MIITECESSDEIKKHELIPNVIDHIFAICKEDKHISINENVTKLDKKLIIAEKQINKQKKLIEQSDQIKANLLEKIKDIDDESFRIKYKVLETLGSEL